MGHPVALSLWESLVTRPGVARVEPPQQPAHLYLARPPSHGRRHGCGQRRGGEGGNADVIDAADEQRVNRDQALDAERAQPAA